MWNKLRNVIVGAALFKKAGKKSAKRRLGSNHESVLSSEDLKDPNMEHAISRSSLDSTHSQDTEAANGDCKSINFVAIFLVIYFMPKIFLYSIFSFEG